MSQSERIARNAGFLMLATTGQKLLAFVSFIIVARLIGREQTGVFFYAISITSIFVTLADLGMTPVVIRAIAADRENGGRYLGAALRTKLFLAPLAVLAAIIYTFSFSASPVILLTVAVACLVMTADTVHLVIYGAFRGRQNLKPEALGMFLGQFFTALASIAAAWFGLGPVGLAGALLIGSSWNVAWSLYKFGRLGIAIENPRKNEYKKLAREALPFGLAGISVKVYSYVDSLFLKQFHGAAEVGSYAVSYKLTYALQFLPLTFTAALYPALAAAYSSKNKDELNKTFLGSLRLMAAIGFPLSAGLSALAPRLIPFLYGQEFVSAVSSFQILPWVLLPIFLDFPVGALLNATHRAYLKTSAMVATMFVNILFNALWVPRYGSLGAAMAGVVSFWALFAIGVVLTRREAGGYVRFISLTARAGFAAAVSWFAWRNIGGMMDLPAAVLFGGAVAVILAFTVRLVTLDDVYRFVRRFKPAPQKVEIVHE